MFDFLVLFLVTFIVFFLIDIVWLAVVAKDLYQSKLGFIMGKTNWIAAILFYVVFIVGLIYFVISPAIDANQWSHALLNGLFFGFVTYATYDLTNLATLKDWPLAITVIDLIWGSVLGGSVSVITFFVMSLL